MEKFLPSSAAAHFQFFLSICEWNGRREDEISKLYDSAHRSEREVGEEEEGKDELLRFWLKGL